MVITTSKLCNGNKVVQPPSGLPSPSVGVVNIHPYGPLVVFDVSYYYTTWICKVHIISIHKDIWRSQEQLQKVLKLMSNCSNLWKSINNERLKKNIFLKQKKHPRGPPFMVINDFRMLYKY